MPLLGPGLIPGRGAKILQAWLILFLPLPPPNEWCRIGDSMLVCAAVELGIQWL